MESAEPEKNKRTSPLRHGVAWLDDENSNLYDLTVANYSVEDIASLHQRTVYSIQLKQIWMGLRTKAKKIEDSNPILPWVDTSSLPFEYSANVNWIPNHEGSAKTFFHKSKTSKIGDADNGSPKRKRVIREHYKSFSILDKKSLIELYQSDRMMFFQLLVDSLVEEIKSYNFKKEPDSNSRSQDIFLSRLGLNSDEDGITTLQALGDKYSVTRERIRQLEKGAYGRMQYLFRRNFQTLDFLEILIELHPHRIGAIAKTRILIALENSGLSYACIYLLGAWALKLMGEQSSQASNLGTAKKTLQKIRQEQRKLEKSSDKSPKGGAQKEYSRKLYMNFFPRIIWPKNIRLKLDFPNTALREAKDPIMFESKKMAKTIYCENKTELAVLMGFESIPEIKRYSEQPFEIPYRLEGRARRYFPDTILEFLDGRQAVVEVKGGNALVSLQTLSKAYYATQELARIGLGYVIIDKLGNGLSTVRNTEINQEVETKFLRLIDEHGTLFWKDILKNFDKVPQLHRQLQAVVLKRKLYMGNYPYSFRRTETEDKEQIFEFANHL